MGIGDNTCEDGISSMMSSNNSALGSNIDGGIVEEIFVVGVIGLVMSFIVLVHQSK
jgi:hypothetical protein